MILAKMCYGKRWTQCLTFIVRGSFNFNNQFHKLINVAARQLRLWVRIPPGHGSLSVVSAVVCCQVEFAATS
jgi:hypothetical protein